MSVAGLTKRLNKSDALALWHRVMLGSVRGDNPDLTARQFVILTTIYLVDGQHTVRSLAQQLSVTKAVVTRALDTLGRHGFVQRCPDPRDKRSIVIQRTARGASYLRAFGDTICSDPALVAA